MTDWLANISLEYILIAVIALLLARFILARYESQTAKSALEITESALVAIALVFLVIRPFLIQAFYIPSGSMRPTLLERDHILVNKLVYRFMEPKYGDIIVFKSPPEATTASYFADRAEWNRAVGEVIAPSGDLGEVKVRRLPSSTVQFDTLREVYVERSNGRSGIMQIEHLYPINDNYIIKFANADTSDAGKALTGAELLVSEKDFIKRLIGKPGDIIEIKDGVVYRNGVALNEPYISEPPVHDFGPTVVPVHTYFTMGDNRNNSNDSRAWGAFDQDKLIGKALVRFWPPSRIGILN